jgi:hypothetical protein
MPIHYASKNKRVRIRGKVIQLGGLNLGELVSRCLGARNNAFTVRD